MTIITNADILALEQKAKAATPGPWERDLTYAWPSKVRSRHPDHSNRWIVDVSSFPSDKYTIPDAAYIAAANPEVTLSLITRLHAAEEALQDLRPDLLAKLGSIIGHVAELRSPYGNELFDGAAIDGLLQDEQVRGWLADMRKLSLLPIARDPTP